MRVSILVPAYNEHSTIVRILNKLVGLPIEDREIIVVDDGSQDGTPDVVRTFIQSHPDVRLFVQNQNLGKTAAISRALQECTGEIIIIQDADLEYDPNEIPDVLFPIVENLADVVYGSRFLVKRASRVLYFYHYLANKSLTFLSNLLTNRNMSDIETCYKAFRREVILPLRLSSRGFGMEIEITAMVCKTRARTYEVPISYYGRTYEEGKKIGMMDGVAAIWYILYYNIFHPWTEEGRKYIAQVDTALLSRSQNTSESPIASDSPIAS